jgi:hypothetical protein
MSGLERRMTDTDRWVLSIATILALVLIVASVVTGNLVYVGYLGGLSTLVFIYWVFAR